MQIVSPVFFKCIFSTCHITVAVNVQWSAHFCVNTHKNYCTMAGESQGHSSEIDSITKADMLISSETLKVHFGSAISVFQETCIVTVL